MVSFELPDWSAPLDVDERIDAAPENGTVRGMFFDQLVATIGDRLPAGFSSQYVPFGSYPLREYMRLLEATARAVHPAVGVREGLRRLGHQVYPMFVGTMVGSALFATAGRDVLKVAALAGRAYGVSMSPGRVSTMPVGPRHLRAQLIDIWPFPASFQIGVFEGALRACGVTGVLKVAVHSASAVDYDVQW